MRNPLVRPFLAFAAGDTLAPQAPASTMPAPLEAMIAKTRQEIRTAGMAEYLGAVRAGNATIVDVREPDEYAAGHVPGAVNLERGKLEFGIWKIVGYPNVDYARAIYLQCNSGTRATLAARTLKELGFTNPVIVLMKFGDWEKAGNPVVVSLPYEA